MPAEAAQKSPVSTVFLFTDASYCQHSGAGGWACAIVDKSGVFFRSGYLGRTVSSSGDAERYALRNAIRVAIHGGFVKTGDEVHVFTDHIGMTGVMQDEQRDDLRGQIARTIADQTRRLGFSLKMSHVKAHVRGPDRQIHHEINAPVDKLARQTMRQLRRLRVEEVAQHLEQDATPIAAFA